MGFWVQDAIEKFSYYTYKEAVLSFVDYQHVFDNKYNNKEIHEADKITKQDFKGADDHFKSVFEQEMEAEGLFLKPGEQFLDNDPEVMSALTFFEDYINGEYDPPIDEEPISFLFLAERQKQLSIIYKNYDKICNILSTFLPPEIRANVRSVFLSCKLRKGYHQNHTPYKQFPVFQFHFGSC